MNRAAFDDTPGDAGQLDESRSGALPNARFHGFAGGTVTVDGNEHIAEPENIFVSLGTLDSPITALPQYHQFVEDAAEWNEIGDNLTKHLQWPNGSKTQNRS